MEKILQSYYADNAKKLHRIVDRILLRFGGISEKDKDDFYSLANEVFADIAGRYDASQPFDGFLYTCLSNKIKTEMTKRNREKRKMDRISISIDIIVEEDEDLALLDVIAGRWTLEEEVFERKDGYYSNKIVKYLDRLSKQQRDVLKLMADGYFPEEIRKILQMDGRQYRDCCAAIHSYRNTSVLL